MQLDNVAPTASVTPVGFDSVDLMEIIIFLGAICIGLALLALNRHLAMSKMRGTVQAFRDLYDNISEGVFRSTLDGRMISANPSLVRLNGFETEQQMLRDVNDIAGQWYVDPKRRAEIHEMLLASGQVSGMVSEVYRYHTRERIWIEESTRLVRHRRTGEPMYYDGTVREVTESIRRLELQSRYDKIASVISGCLYQHRQRPDGTSALPYASQGIRNLFGVDPKDVVEDGSILGRHIHPDDLLRIRATLDHSLNTLTTWQCEYRVNLPGQREKWIFAHAFPEREPDGSTLWHGFLTDVSERKHSEARIFRLAYFDQLTGLPNRVMLLERLGNAFAAGGDQATHSALLFLDLDNFKLLNDSKGHQVGDRLLKEVASRLSSRVAPPDLVARFGGDEFVVLSADLGPDLVEAEEKARAFAGECLELISLPVELDGFLFSSTGSIGVTIFRGSEKTVEILLKQADLAMYEAKARRRGSICFFEPGMEAAAEENLLLRNELREAIEGGQFSLLYQPQVTGAGECVGAEALLRWNHPERGVIPPKAFLPLAEANGLSASIDDLVLGAACATLRLWRDRPDTRHLDLAINISAQEMGRKEFAGTVSDALGEAGVDPARLTLELTEHVMFSNVTAVGETVRRLKAMGVRVALDDFGTGYSSLSHLKLLPIDALKIDRSFVGDLDTNPNDRAIVQTIVNVAESLGVSVVAEGVETELQAVILRQMGCQILQGFLFARPMPLTDFIAFATAARNPREPVRLVAQNS